MALSTFQSEALGIGLSIVLFLFLVALVGISYVQWMRYHVERLPLPRGRVRPRTTDVELGTIGSNTRSTAQDTSGPPGGGNPHLATGNPADEEPQPQEEGDGRGWIRPLPSLVMNKAEPVVVAKESIATRNEGRAKGQQFREV